MADSRYTEGLDGILARASIGIAQIDPSGQFLSATDAYCALIGRPRVPLLTTRIQDVTHLDDLPGLIDVFGKVLDTGAAQALDVRHLRDDGSYVWVGCHVSHVVDAGGGPPYLLVLATDVAGRKGAERARAPGHADLRLLLDSAPGALYCMNRRGVTTLVNSAFLRLLGFTHEDEVLERDLHELIHHTHADGTPYPPDECPILRAAHSGTTAHVADDVFFRKDGTSFPVEYWVRPIVRNGEVEGAICTCVDLTERKANEMRQQIMNQELAHRVKNSLAMVQAIVAQTLRNTPDRQDAVQAINQRLIALGNAHTALTRTRWGSAAIVDVVEGALAAHRAGNARIETHGPQLDLGAKASLAVGMALHELCTNAAKYGALSTDQGRVRIEWNVTGGAADATFHMSWVESGGPPVVPPTRKGFGSRLIADAIGADLHGTSTLRYEPTGVTWTLAAALVNIRK